MRGKSTNKTKELNDKIIELYKQGISAQKISHIVHVSTKYTSTILKNADINFGILKFGKLVNEQEIIAYYNKIKSLTKTASFFKISVLRIKRILIKNNIVITRLRKSINYQIFDVIDTEEKAYWLGFIYADGYISSHVNKKRYNVEIKLNVKDKEHLFKFNRFINGEDRCIRYCKQKQNNKIYYSIGWSCENKHLWETLYSLGVVPKKSLILKFPNTSILPEKLQIPFIRGYFDGDGSISTIETSCSKLYTEIAGTENFLLNLDKIISSYPTTVIQFKTKTSTIYYLRYKIIKSICFYKKIYYNPVIYLDRKYNLWINYCRSNMKMLESLEDKFGKDWDVNSEIIYYVNYNRYRNA